MSANAESIVEACRNLPTIPAIALEVLRLSRDDEADLRQIASVISQDVALSSRLLKVVNSSFYGLRRKVSTISQAVVMLGLASVKTLALGFSLADGLSGHSSKASDLKQYWRRSLLFGVASRTFAEKRIPILREEAFVAGLLADIGTFAMSEALGDDYVECAVSEQVNHIAMLNRERERFGVDHQEVGRHMAESWHLPELLTVPVGCHHNPEGCGDVDPMVADLTGVVYAANLCAETFCGQPSQEDVARFEEAAQKYVGVDQAACRELIENLHTDVGEVSTLLDMKVPESMSYAEIVRQASEELARLSLESQQETQKIERDRRKAVSRVQELEETNRQLAQNANCDPLTGIYNRRFLESFLEREIARAQRFRRPMSLLFIDVDHFKEVNDKYGHHGGDSVLQQITQLLKAATREVDCLCRYGGEEFVLTLLETDLLGAKQVGEKIRRLVAAWKFDIDGLKETLHVTISVGVATMNPRRPMDKDVLLQMADESVYAAKSEGRNCVCALRKRVLVGEDGGVLAEE
jgi:diguanylate cyclase (GGDEF)-like protein